MFLPLRLAERIRDTSKPKFKVIHKDIITESRE